MGDDEGLDAIRRSGGVRRPRLWPRSGKPAADCISVAVVGETGPVTAMLSELLAHPDRGLAPAAVVADQAVQRGRLLLGVPIVCSLEDPPGALAGFGVAQILVAPSPRPGPLIEWATQAAEAVGIPVTLLPRRPDGITGLPHPREEPVLSEILGRSSPPGDLSAVRALLRGRRVLVTGAGGTVGAEICRQVAPFEPELLVPLDHDDTHLHDIAETLECDIRPVLADVTDRLAILDAFAAWRPEVVLHAAAHKHVPILEDHPAEGVRNNVFGTLNVIQAANRVGVSHFVLVSTDKAVHPVSVMGASKRLGELILQAYCPPGRSYCAVRFGNVFGSRGSVVPTFSRQIESGGPLTVTHPDMTRYFMSVEEAVHLVLHSARFSRSGDLFVLDMGEPVNILDLAQRMIRRFAPRTGGQIPIEVVGLRPGERLLEQCHGMDEEKVSTSHPRVWRVVSRDEAPSVPLETGLEELRAAVDRRDEGLVRRLLFDLVGPPPPEPTEDWCEARPDAGRAEPVGVSVEQLDMSHELL